MFLSRYPAGNPNAYHAASARYVARKLEAFYVPWFPGHRKPGLIAMAPRTTMEAARLRWRRSEPPGDAPKMQYRVGEWTQLLRLKLGLGNQSMIYEANNLLMRIMARARADFW